MNIPTTTIRDQGMKRFDGPGAMPIRPINHRGNLCLPAESIEVCLQQQISNGDSSFGVALILSLCGAGVFQCVTPDQARTLAQSLNNVADQVDEQIAAQASEAIDRARKGPGQ